MKIYVPASLFLGVDHVGGDMFESVPKGEVIFMKVSPSAMHIYLKSY